MELLQLAQFWSHLSPSPENSHSLEFCDNYPLGFLYTFIIQVCFPGHYTLNFLFIWLRCVLSFLIYILPPLALSFHDSVSAEDHRMFELCTLLSAHSLGFTDCMLIEYLTCSSVLFSACTWTAQSRCLFTFIFDAFEKTVSGDVFFNQEAHCV